MYHRWREDEIIEGCINNKKRARKALYEHYHGYLLAVAMQYSKDRYEAESILLESLLKIYNKIGGYERKAPFVNWMKSILINTAIDKIRKDKKFRQNISIEDIPGGIESGTVEIEDKFGAEEILSAIQQLPPSYKAVFNLYAIEGYSHNEIAEMLQISVNTSKSNLHRARKILKKLLEDINE